MEGNQHTQPEVSINLSERHTDLTDVHSHHTAKGIMGCIGGLFVHLIISSLYQWGTINIYITSYYKYTNDETLTLENNVIIFPVMMICIGATMRLGLFLSKKFGAIPVLFCINILSAASVFISSFIPNFEGFIAFYGILFGLFVGGSFMIPIVQCNKFFPTKKMYVNGVILVGTGLGSLIFGTFSYNYINYEYQQPVDGYYLNDMILRVPQSLKYLSLLYLIIGALGTCLLIPVIRYNQEYAKTHKVIDIGQGQAQSICQVISTSIFWKKILVLLLATTGVFLITGNYKTYVKDQIEDDNFLTLIGSIGALGNGCSRFFWSLLFNKTGYKFVMTLNICILLVALASIRFTIIDTHEAYLFLVFIVNCCLGGYLVITPIFSQLVFGQSTGSNAYGFFWTTYSIANFIQFAYVSTLEQIITFENIIYVCMGMAICAIPLINLTKWQGPWQNPITALQYCQGSAQNTVKNQQQNLHHWQCNKRTVIKRATHSFMKKQSEISQNSSYSLQKKALDTQSN